MASSQDFFDQRLTSLKTELKTYGAEIVDHVTSLYGKNRMDSRFDLKNDAFSMLSVLRIDVAEIIKEYQEKKEYKELHAAELEECSQLSELLTHIATVIDKISHCESLISQVLLIPACEAIDEVSNALNNLPGPSTEIGSGKVCNILRKEVKLLHCRLVSKLNRILKESIQFDYGRITIHQELKGVLRSEDIIINEPIKLTDVWTAVHLCHRGDEMTERLLKELWQYILFPLWREKKAQSPRCCRIEEHGVSELHFEHIAREGKAHEAAYSSLAASLNSGGKGAMQRLFAQLGPCKMPIPQLFDYVGQVFEFFWTEVVRCNDEIADSVAQKLADPPFALMQTLIETILHQLPKSESELSVFRRALEAPCRILENKLRNVGFAPWGEEDEEEQDGDDDLEKENNLGSADGGGTNAQAASTLTRGVIVECKKAQSNFIPLGPLSSYITDLPSIYADLRRQEVLKMARDVVLSDYHNTMMAAGDAAEDELSSAGDVGDPRAVLDQSVSFALQPLKFETCQTSLAACRLLKLMHDIMKQASATTTTTTTGNDSVSNNSKGGSGGVTAAVSPEVAHVLYQSARDCLELFIAIVPMHFADVIESIPRMGAVFYNDCLYIAHNCTLITHKYRHDMAHIDPVLEQTVGFADFIPRFRSLGDQCLVRHIEEQRVILADLVARVNVNPEGSDTEAVVTRGHARTSLLASTIGVTTGIASSTSLASSSVSTTAGATSTEAIGGTASTGTGTGSIYMPPPPAQSTDAAATSAPPVPVVHGIEIRPGGLLKGGLQLAGKIGSRIGFGEDITGATGDSSLHSSSSSSSSSSSNGGGNNPNDASYQPQNDDEAAVLVRRHMERLSAQWLGVLQDSVYARLLGYLLDSLLVGAMAPVLTTECVAEAAGAEISRVYRTLQQIRLIFPAEATNDDSMQRICTSWKKFLALTDLLEYSLSEVAEWLPRKKFSSFTGQEMTNLIQALFEDTPRRQTVLASILEMSS